jgi:hypothetical protein
MTNSTGCRHKESRLTSVLTARTCAARSDDSHVARQSLIRPIPQDCALLIKCRL